MWWTEYSCNPQNPNQFERAGTIRIRKYHKRRRRSPVLVIAKLGAASAMTLIAMAAASTTSLPIGVACLTAFGTVLVYALISYYVRPEPNVDNLGWFGFNDPFQYNDNINRALLSLHCFLAPGRFIAETVLEFCVLMNLLSEVTEADIESLQLREMQAERNDWKAQAQQRVAQRQAVKEHNGVVELDSTRYFKSQQP